MTSAYGSGGIVIKVTGARGPDGSAAAQAILDAAVLATQQAEAAAIAANAAAGNAQPTSFYANAIADQNPTFNFTGVAFSLPPIIYLDGSILDPSEYTWSADTGTTTSQVVVTDATAVKADSKMRATVGVAALIPYVTADNIPYSPSTPYPNGSMGMWMDWVSEGRDLRFYGYVGSGIAVPLSSVNYYKGVKTTGYTLLQWKGLVPEVTALTNSIDRIAVQGWFNDRPNGGSLALPAGEGVFDAGIKTGANQQMELIGSGREGTRIRHTGTDWLWEHGWTKGEANSSFTVKNLTIVPAAGAGAAGAFRVRFSGNQRPWCHNISDVIIYPEDGNSYYIQPTETWNIKRGLDWENFIVYGRHFYTQATDAHLFPPNIGADCPTGQLQTISGNSYNFDNCMVIGYHDGWRFDFTGFTSSSSHCHEEGRWYACEVYSGVGFASIVDTNLNYAPSDNWLFEQCGWQGTGRCFDFQNLEFVRCTGGLFVSNTTTAPNHVWLGNFIDCRDLQFNGNEVFAVPGSAGITMFFVGGLDTRGVEINDNGIVNYASVDQFVYIASNCPRISVEERANRFAGSGTWVNSTKVVDASNQNISETRVNEIMAVWGSASAAWDVRKNGDIVFNDSIFVNSDASGNINLSLPPSLFRSINCAYATSQNPSVNSPVAVGPVTTTTMPIRYPAVSSITALQTAVEVIGR